MRWLRTPLRHWTMTSRSGLIPIRLVFRFAAEERLSSLDPVCRR